jgi:DNA-binding transcriptional LysR family regulator
MDAIAVFVRVVEAGSFSAAASRLRMPKTTVSAKVAGLERRLGVRLIHRTTRKLRMTEAGEKYFNHCAIAIREVELGEAALQLTKEKPSGVLKVTTPVDLANTLLPPIARAYMKKYPNVSLELIVTNQVMNLVDEGIDVAIRWAKALNDSSLIARRFFEARSSLWASRKYIDRLSKLTHPRDLANAMFVAHRVQKRSVMLTNGRSDFEVRMNGRVQADDLGTIKALVVLGAGVAWLPDYSIADAAKAGKVVRVLPQWHPKQQQWATCYFVYASRQYALPKVESFIETALKLV